MMAYTWRNMHKGKERAIQRMARQIKETEKEEKGKNEEKK